MRQQVKLSDQMYSIVGNDLQIQARKCKLGPVSNIRTTLLALALTGAVMSCGDHDSILNQIHQHNNGYGHDDDAETTTGSTSGSPWQETTGADMGASGSSSTGMSGNGDEPFSFEIHANTDMLAQAGSIVLSVEVHGDSPASSMDLFVSNDDGPVQKITWPIGQESLEYIVDGPHHNGTKEFRLIAQTGEPPAIDAVTVEVQLPPSGTLSSKFVGAPGSVAKAVLVEPGIVGFGDRVYVVMNNADGLVELGERTPSGHVQLRPLVEEQPLEITSATMLADRSIVFVGSVGKDSEVRLYREVGGSWQRYWVRTFEDTVLHDSAAVGDDIVVAGEKLREDGVDAVAWQLTASGGTVKTDTLSAVTPDDFLLDSSILAVAVEGERAVGVGYVAQVNGDEHPHKAKLFSFIEDLAVVDHPLNSWKDESEFVAGTFRAGGSFVAAGWANELPNNNRHGVVAMLSDTLGPLSMKLLDANLTVLQEHQTSLVVGGLVENQLLVEKLGHWAYMEQDIGELHGVAVDQFGYIHAVGALSVNDQPHAFLLTLNP